MAVKKIPEGFHTVTPYLTFKDCAAAISLYKKAFGALEGDMLRGPDGKVGHASITIGNSQLFMADENPAMGNSAPSDKGSSVNFYLYVDEVDTTHKKALAAGLKELMPVNDTFWGDRMGALSDPFGYKWNLATKIKDMTPEEVAQAAKEFFSKAA